MHPRAAAQDGVSSIRRPFSRTTQPALRNGIPIRSPPASTPPAPPAGRLPTRFCRGTPTPPAPSARDTHTLLPAAPTPPAPSQKDTHTLLPGHPHPTRACGAPPPPPEGGGGSAWRYQGNSRAWGDAWCATVLWSSPGSPHVLDRGDIATGGGGPRGGGTRSPSPVSHTPTTLLLAGRLPVLLSPSPTPPAWVRAIPMMVRDELCLREHLASIPGEARE